MSLYEIEEHIGALIEEAEWAEESDLDKYAVEIEEWKRLMPCRASWLKTSTNLLQEGSVPAGLTGNLLL